MSLIRERKETIELLILVAISLFFFRFVRKKAKTSLNLNSGSLEIDGELDQLIELIKSKSVLPLCNIESRLCLFGAGCPFSIESSWRSLRRTIHLSNTFRRNQWERIFLFLSCRSVYVHMQWSISSLFQINPLPSMSTRRGRMFRCFSSCRDELSNCFVALSPLFSSYSFS